MSKPDWRPVALPDGTVMILTVDRDGTILQARTTGEAFVPTKLRLPAQSEPRKKRRK